MFLIRTHRYTEQEAELALTLSGVADPDNIAFVVDDRLSEISTGQWQNISLSAYNENLLQELEEIPDWGWRCGDLCYTAARAAWPTIERFWLIESDVWIPPHRTEDLFDKLNYFPQDAIAAGLGKYSQPPRYSKTMKQHIGTDRWGCIFPFTGASARLIDTMSQLRLCTLQAFTNQQKRHLFPNDEAVFAGAAAIMNHTYVDLYQVLPEYFQKKWYNTNPPHLLEALNREKLDLVVHPAIPLRDIIREIKHGKRKNYNRHRLRRVLSQAREEERAEIMDAMNLE